MAKILTLAEKRQIAATKIFASSPKREGDYDGIWSQNDDVFCCRGTYSTDDGDYTDWYWCVEFKPNSDEIIKKFTA